MEKLSQFMVAHWDLILLLLAVLIAITVNEWLDSKKKAKELSPQETIRHINANDAVLFDIRDKESFQKGHIIHSKHVTENDFDKEKMSKYKNKSLVIVCTRGQQSRILAAKLRTKGFNQAMVLSGGITAWQNADLPLVKGK